MSERYEDSLRARRVVPPTFISLARRATISHEERDALADAVRTLREIADADDSHSDWWYRDVAREAIARLDSFVSSPTTETPTPNLRNTSVSKKTTKEA